MLTSTIVTVSMQAIHQTEASFLARLLVDNLHYTNCVQVAYTPNNIEEKVKATVMVLHCLIVICFKAM